MNSLVRGGLPTERIETILTLEMRCKPHFQNKNVLTSCMTSSIRHQFFEFSQGDRPDFPLSNFKKKIIFIFVLSLLSSSRSGLPVVHKIFKNFDAAYLNNAPLTVSLTYRPRVNRVFMGSKWYRILLGVRVRVLD